MERKTVQKSQVEPWIIQSMDELLALAGTMEQEAIDGYVKLAERMRTENRADLTAVFESLIAEEKGHLEQVNKWSEKLDQRPVTGFVVLPEPLFDDEGAGIVAQELLDSYRAFSIAVRNEERAFVFWTYVAAHAPSQEIGHAAEHMATEELGHIAKLRRERRRAFHKTHRAGAQNAQGDLAVLEMRFAEHLQVAADAHGAVESERLVSLAREARQRSLLLSTNPFERTPLLNRVPRTVTHQLVPLSELLLDCYLDLAEREKGEPARDRAQQFATNLVQSLHVVRSLQPRG